MTATGPESSRSTFRGRCGCCRLLTRLLPLACQIRGRGRCRSGCCASGVFVLSKTAVHEARVLRPADLRLRSMEGASWSQIRCRNGRSVRRGCARVATPKRAAWTAAPAARSRLSCPRWPAMNTEYPADVRRIPDPAEKSLLAGSLLSPMVRHGSGWGGEPVYTPSAVLGRPHDGRRQPQVPSPCGLVPPPRTQKEPMLRKGNVLYCVDRAQGSQGKTRGGRIPLPIRPLGERWSLTRSLVEGTALPRFAPWPRPVEQMQWTLIRL